MELLIAIDQFTRSHVWFSMSVVFSLLVWISIKKYVFKQSILENYPSIVAVVDLVLFPFAIMCVGGLLYFALQLNSMPQLETPVQFVFHLLTILSIAWCLARFVEITILSRSKRESNLNYLPGIQRGLLFGIALFIGLMLFLSIKGYSITGLYVSTGAAAALVAFAMQRTLGDLFSGIALSIEHPFRLGDWIELEDGSQGQVMDINWRATRFRAWDKATLIVPNSELARQKIKNLHGPDHGFSPWYKIKIAGDVDPRFIKALLLEAALRCKNTLKTPLPVVRLIDATTIPYTYMVWVHFKNYPQMFAGREELFREIHYSLKEVGMQVASDLHEIHTRNVELINVVPPDTFSALKALDLANVLNEDELKKVAGMSQRHMFEADTVLVKEGGTAKAFDIIVTGIVESSITTKLGHSKIVNQLKVGEYFGISSMIIDTPSFLQFRAVTDVTLIRVNLECFRDLLKARPEIAEGLAEVVKQRMAAAEEIRLVANKPAPKLTLQDILKRVETLLH